MNTLRKSKFEELERLIPTIERPSCIREIAQKTGISEQTVAKHLAIMEARGKIRLKNLGGVIVVL